eukprot:gene36288-44022_t
MPSVDAIIDFIRHVNNYADSTLICIEDSGVSERYERAIRNNSGHKVHVIQIKPWGYYTTALNMALQMAQDLGFPLIAFQSLECTVSREKVQLMRGMLTPDTLVLGLRFDGHVFEPGKHVLTGTTTPWNTFAIWHVDHLGRVGFPLIGDGQRGDRENGGVEEVTAISLLQLLDPSLKAVLVGFDIARHEERSRSISSTAVAPRAVNDDHAPSHTSKSDWQTHFNGDAKRLKYHEQKMRSKESRPRKQLEYMGLRPGWVEHLAISM